MTRKPKMIQVEKDVFDFLVRCCYTSSQAFLRADVDHRFSTAIDTAITTAYGDLCRTLWSVDKTKDAQHLLKLAKNARLFLAEEVRKFVNKGIGSQDEFDKWHEATCEILRSIYRNKDAKRLFKPDHRFTYGHAQKWLNMTLKRLYVLEPEKIRPIAEFLHPPVDKVVIAEAKRSGVNPKDLGLDRTWSKWDGYNNYKKYQAKLRECIKERPLFRWEFGVWNRNNH